MIGRPLREGVGRNGARAIWYLTGLPVALYARAWVEIDLMIEKMNDLESRPLREGVGRNYVFSRKKYGGNPVALYARAWVEI